MVELVWCIGCPTGHEKSSRYAGRTRRYAAECADERESEQRIAGCGSPRHLLLAAPPRQEQALSAGRGSKALSLGEVRPRSTVRRAVFAACARPVWPVRAFAGACRYMDMCIRGLSLADMAAEASQITGMDPMRVKRWFYRKISQSRRSGNAPPKHNTPASKNKPCMPQTFKAPAGSYFAAGSGKDWLSGDHNKEKRSDLTRSYQVTPPGDSLNQLIASERRLVPLNVLVNVKQLRRPGQGNADFPSLLSCNLRINSAEFGGPAGLHSQTVIQATTPHHSDSHLLLDLNAHSTWIDAMGCKE